MAFSPDGTKIVSGGFDSMVRLWDVQTHNLIGAVSAHKYTKDGQPVPYQVWSVAFSPDGSQIVTGAGFDFAGGDQNNLVQLWNVDPPAPRCEPKFRVLRGGTSTALVSALTGNGSFGQQRRNRPAVGRRHRTEAVQPMSRDQNFVFSVAFANTHRGSRPAAGRQSADVGHHHHADELALDVGTNWVQTVAFSPDDKWIVSGSGDGNLRLWPAPESSRRCL